MTLPPNLHLVVPPRRPPQTQGRGAGDPPRLPLGLCRRTGDRPAHAGACPRRPGGARGWRASPARPCHRQHPLQDHRPDARPRSRGADRHRPGSPRRLATALALRARLFDAPFYRLVHAEADGLPGIVIDRFGDVAVIQPNAAWAEAHLDSLAAALVEVTGVTTIVKNGTGRSRGLEGLPEETVVLRGALSGPGARADERGHLHGRPAGRAEDRHLL